MLPVRMSKGREDRAHLVKALNAIAKMEGHMVSHEETRTGPLDAYSPGDLRPVIGLAGAMDKQRVIEAEPVKAEGPPRTDAVRGEPVACDGAGE